MTNARGVDPAGERSPEGDSDHQPWQEDEPVRNSLAKTEAASKHPAGAPNLREGGSARRAA